MAHNENYDGRYTEHWYRLFPILNAQGQLDYVDAVWQIAAQLPTGYHPLAFGSAVLPDGRLIIEGGEYCDDHNFCSPDNRGAIYTPLPPPNDSWAAVGSAPLWMLIGGSSSVVLPSGTYMQADSKDYPETQTALLNATNLTWTLGAHTQGALPETGWTLLTNNKVLMVETHTENNQCVTQNFLGYELYDPTSNQWTCGGSTPPLPLYLAQGYGTDEIGAAVMMYNGSVLQFGGDDTHPSTGLYKVGNDSWMAGAVPPTDPNTGKTLIQTDGPAVLEPDGNVLGIMSPWLCDQQPNCNGSCDPVSQCGKPGDCQAVEYTPSPDGSGIGSFQLLTGQGRPQMCTNHNSSVPGHMLLLPNGQIMLSYYTTQIEIFNPANNSPISTIRPHIATQGPLTAPINVPTALFGFQFNGLSQANMFGDDYQAASNFPIVQISEVDANCMGAVVSLVPTANDFVPYGSPQSNLPNSIQPANETGTYFTIPVGFQTGTYNLSVITNGIQSDNCITVNITSN